MILACPECSARFAVPDTLMPPAGRTVKCGRCAHMWFAEGVEPTPEADFAALAQEAAAEAEPVIASQLPVRQAPPIAAKPFMIAAGALATAWLLLAFMAYYPSWMNAPVLGGIYRTLGIQSSEGLVFEDISMQRNSGETSTQYLLTGSVANRSDVTKQVPVVRVQLKNASGDDLWERDYKVDEPLKAGAAYPFRIDNVETSFSSSVSSIVLDVGHPMQLRMR